MLAIIAWAIGCTGGTTPPAAECEPCPECAANGLEDWEANILKDDLAALRAGVTGFGDEGFGICQGEKTCESFMGPEVGELAPGKYIIHSELAVPKVGDPWKVRFDIHCVTEGKGGSTTDYNHDKTYEIIYAGKDRGYRLTPLWKIDSPHRSGARECDYSLTPIRPDGQDGTPITGSYSTPMPE